MSIKIQELETKLAQVSIEHVKAELGLKLCQARHKRYKADRATVSGDALEVARASYHEAVQDEGIARDVLSRVNTRLVNIQSELVQLYMADAGEELRVVAEIKSAY